MSNDVSRRVARAAAAALVALFALVASPHAFAQARSSCAYTAAPAGAAALGVTNETMCLQPNLNSVSSDGVTEANLPLWGCLPYQGACARSTFIDVADSATTLTMSAQPGNNGYQMVSVPTAHGPSATPTLPGNVPWYTESCITDTNNNLTNWQAFWLMPLEHDNAGDDHAHGYVEIDVLENASGLGVTDTNSSSPHYNTLQNIPMSTAINWAWGGSSYTKISQTSSYGSGPILDYTQPHCFGVSWQPTGSVLKYYVDDTLIETVSGSQITSALSALHYYLMWTNQTSLSSGSSGFEMLINSYRIYMNPLVTIGNPPAASTTSTSAAFTFTTASSGTIYCQLDGGAISTSECTALGAMTGLSVGSHTVNAYLYQTPGLSGTSQNPYFVDATYTWTVAPSIARSSCAYNTTPAGAASIGLSSELFCLAPTYASVGAPGAATPLFVGPYWFNTVTIPQTVDSAYPNTLTLKNPGTTGTSYGVSTVSTSGSLGTIPLLPGDVPWYAETCYSQTSYNTQNWPAFWLLAIELQWGPVTDHYPALNATTNYEYWWEPDVDEGGYNTSATGASLTTTHDWEGVQPSTTNTSNSNNNDSSVALTRTNPNCFGLAWKPSANTLTWWGNDALETTVTGSGGTSGISPAAKLQHMQLIVSDSNISSTTSTYELQVQSMRVYMNPLVVFSGLPPATTTAVTASITASSPSAIGTVQCQIDGGAISAAECTALASLSGLAVGTHTINGYYVPTVSGAPVSLLNTNYVDATYTWTIVASSGESSGTPVSTTFAPMSLTAALLPNPDKGVAGSSGADFVASFSASSIASEVASGERLVYCPADLGAFTTSAITTTWLSTFQTNMAAVRAAGAKCMLMLGFNLTTPGPDATVTQIQALLTQLGPYLKANADVIPLAKAGMIGTLGEWANGTSGNSCGGSTGISCPNATVAANRAAVRDALLAAYHPFTQIGFRSPDDIFNWYATPLSALGAFTGSPQSRVAMHNDSVLTSAGGNLDSGTWLDSQGIGTSQTQLETYVQTISNWTAYFGDVSSISSPQITDCPSALSYFATYHGAAFKMIGADAAPFTSSWSAGGCLTQIQNQLGYWIQLNSIAHESTALPGQSVTFQVSAQNLGWSRVFTPRRLVANICLTTSPYTCYAGHSSADLRALAPQATAASMIQIPLVIPGAAPAGTYQVQLSAPDYWGTLQSRPFMLQFANVPSGAQSWNDTAGYLVTGTTVVVQ